MAILPVLDLMGGQVVRGVAGRRAEYRPVVSRLTTEATPLAVARAFREQFGFDELYLADLDALAGAPPALDVYRRLHDDGFRLWVDAGLRTTTDAVPLLEVGVASIIAGLETVDGPAALSALVECVGAGRLVFSLDLTDGTPLTQPGAWSGADADAIAAAAFAQGVRRLLVLDLRRVGVGTGAGTEPLVARLRQQHPALEITAGGGVRDIADVGRLRTAGADRVLVASALHDGRIAPADVAAQAGRHS